ncbi:chymotrypsin-like protease CTRL-1 [Drosophila simulans]|nr:chymotrypsin-like protease CTRL-1 [Drosophila simulans]
MSHVLSLALIGLVVCQGLAQLLDEKCHDPEISKNINFNHGAIEAAPWMARIYNNNQFICEGTLVHKLFVLTAASCILRDSQLYVLLGMYSQHNNESHFSNNEQYGVAVAIQNSMSYPNNGVNDIGLLRLYGEVTYNAHIRPICIILDHVVRSAPFERLKAFGWMQQRTEASSQVGQTVYLSQKKPFECHRNGQWLPINEGQFCAGNNDRSFCEGYSGSPLTADFTYGERNITVQVGMVSYGSELCSPTSVYTDVVAFKDWIYRTVRKYETKGDQVVYEECRSNWAEDVLVRLWEVSLLQNTISGVLITNKFVLTVASAFRNIPLAMKVETKYGKSLDVESIHRHPLFTFPSMDNDIALLKLAYDVPNSDLVKPICIVSSPELPRMLTALVDETTNDFRGVRNLNPIKHIECARRIGKPLKSNQFCVEKPSDFEVQAPGSIIGTYRNIGDGNRYYLIGLMSYSKDGMLVYTEIQSFLDWIMDKVYYD